MKPKSPASLSLPKTQKKQIGANFPPINRESSFNQMEKEYIEREQHLLAVANSVQDAIVSADSDGNVIFWNEGARKHFGYEESEIIGQPLLKILPERFRKAHTEGMKRFTETGEKRVIGHVVELAGLHKNGSEFPIELSLGVWETERGKYFTGIMRNISERVHSENALRRSQSALDATNDGVFMFSPETMKFFYVNEGAVNQVGYTHKELLQMTPLDIKPEFTEPQFRQMVAPMISGEVNSHFFRTVHRHKNGTDIPVEIILQNVTSNEGEKLFVAMVRDITEREQVEKALRQSENRLRTLLDSMIEGLVQADRDEKIEFVNDRFCEMTGFERNEIIGKTTYDFVYDEANFKIVREANRNRLQGISGDSELKLQKKSGEHLYVMVGGAPLTNGDGEIVGTMGVFTDITERKRAEAQLLHDAFHDGLTGLANRALFMDHLRRTIERSRSRHSNKYAVLFLDFDRFKLINDSLGHAEGDELLRQIALRLQASTRTADLTARLGGDEFVILLNELASADEALIVARRILNELKIPFNLIGSEIFISASIGIALSTAGHKCAEDMLRDADIAMYRAKSNGKAQYKVFDYTMHEQASRRFSLETEMRRALENEEFELHYQPIINLKDGKLKGFESLVRWRHPERGMIPPFEFIPAAEENGLIHPLGEWIIRESCRQMNYWHEQSPQYLKMTISVNLSAKQFTQIDLAEQITTILDETGLNPARLCLEITESELMQNNDSAVKMMNRLHEIGVGWSLDDFGTGYSSLSYLHRLPVNFLKIDRSFIGKMTESREKYEIVNTIIKLAKNLKMMVIAEGIEEQEQLEILKQLYCEFGQGYLFSKPMEAKRVKSFIEKSFKTFEANQKRQNLKFQLTV